MKNITALVSGHALNFRALGLASTTAALAASLATLLPGTAQAQTIIGNAYSVKVGAGANLNSSLNLTTSLSSITTGSVGLNVGPLSNTGNLASPSPNQTLTGIQANATVTSGLTGLVGGLGLGAVLGDVLGVGLQTTSTTSLIPSPGFGVTSTASVATVGLFNSLTSTVDSLLNINANGSLISATTIQSITSARADGSGNVGQTVLVDLKVNGSAITNEYLLANSIGASIDANGVVSGSGSIIVNGFNGSRLGELRINEQIINGDGSLTTNALHLVLDPNASIFANLDVLGAPLLNSKVGAGANAGVILASSTAGFAPSANVAAPEPGSLALAAMGLLPAAGLLIRRRRAAKK